MSKKIPIALQLYSVREDCAKDLPGVLKAVAKMGYQGVEFAGYHGYSAKQLRTMLDDLGLKASGTHIQLDRLQPDVLAQTIEFHRELGCSFLIVPWLAEELRNTRAACLKVAEQFNAIAAALAPHGMKTGYHNHDFEFKPLDGSTVWDLFFGHTRPEVIMQLDTGNALHGGADTVPFLTRYPGRALTVHLKEHSATNKNAILGEGDVRWKDIFNLCETHGGTQWYVVEQESYALPPLQCVEKCLQNLRAMGK